MAAKPISTSVTSTAATSYADPSPEDGAYYYSIFAEDAAGNASVQATSTATVDTRLPISIPAPSGGGAGFSLIAPSAVNASPLGFSVSNGSYMRASPHTSRYRGWNYV